ncbi:hypothetical protein FPANT_13203 [Fusarium pseudoanthophilum]|uniref:Uncharacterized protein n=1 Tax=Fusarium pseudoanthophilum TaxID=48495 RepID=A0A8H5KHT6_9HYPO|nr:hypothetical protein FPANT_13203 [Fusarium pseudoanthophilum]
MAPPHHQSDRNGSHRSTSGAQAESSQNEDVVAAQRAVDEAMERQRQAQLDVEKAMKRQREVQREVAEAMERQREVVRQQSRAASVTGGQARGGRRGSQSQTRSHRQPSIPSNRNTSAASNRNTSSFRRASRATGITNPQQSSSVWQGVTTNHVPEAERHSYHIPPNCGGSVEGFTKDPSELEAVGDHLLNSMGYDSVSYRVEPKWNDAKRFMENEEVLVRVTSSNGRTKPGKGATLGEPGRFTEISQEPVIRCVNCRLKTHTLRHCLDAENEPEIYGCILCNNDNHMVDQCGQFKSMSLKEQVDLLVFERANMPGLAVSKDFPKWYDLLEQAISSGDIDANGPMKGFPWTGQFCCNLCCEEGGDTIRALQKKFDESGFDMSILPVDPNTASLSAVQGCYSERP